jgi:hypothetical protein
MQKRVDAKIAEAYGPRGNSKTRSTMDEVENIPSSEIRPVLSQYMDAKKSAPPGDIVLVKSQDGDFYDTFFDDAVKFSEAGDTGAVVSFETSGDPAGPIVPMVGVPAHAIERFARNTVNNGFSLTVVEPGDAPKTSKKKTTPPPVAKKTDTPPPAAKSPSEPRDPVFVKREEQETRIINEAISDTELSIKRQQSIVDTTYDPIEKESRQKRLDSKKRTLKTLNGKRDEIVNKIRGIEQVSKWVNEGESAKTKKGKLNRKTDGRTLPPVSGRDHGDGVFVGDNGSVFLDGYAVANSTSKKSAAGIAAALKNLPGKSGDIDALSPSERKSVTAEIKRRLDLFK